MNNLSIIIPIYKAEKYLHQCIDSVLCQSYKDFELILVDDGSPDNSGKICDEYAKRDSRIIVIHKENQGSVLARKSGFDISKGVYVSFLDSDDWIEPEFYESIFQKNNDYDVFCCGFTSEYEDGSTLKQENSIVSGLYCNNSLKSFLESCLFNGKFFENGIVPALWCKIFRKTLVAPILSIVDPKIRMGEDAAITFPVLANAKSVYVDNQNYKYHYRRLSNSMSTAYDKYYFSRLLSLHDHLIKQLEEKEIWENQLVYYFVNLITIGFFSEFRFKLHKNILEISNEIFNDWIKKIFYCADLHLLSKDAKFLRKIVLSKKRSFLKIRTFLYVLKRKFFK